MAITVRVIFCILAFSFAVGCGKSSDDAKEQPAVTIDPTTIEKVVLVLKDELYRSVGTVKSKNAAQLSSKIMGTVREIKVREGDEVEAGAVLMSLSSKELEARLEAARGGLFEIQRNLAEAEAAKEEAEAQFQLAKITFMRFQDLMERESVSLQEFDQAKATYEIAQARLRRAEETVGSLEARKKQVEASLEEAKTFYSYTRVEAPFSGIITQKMVNEGDLTMSGTPLLMLEDNRHYQLESFVDESQAGKINRGDVVGVTLDALGEERLKGEVAEVIPQIDPVSRTFQVKLNLPRLPALQSGMFGKAYFPVGKRTMILVPKGALLECGELSSLLVINPKGRAERRLVKEGKEYDGKVEILSGLDVGESIVARDVLKVKEGCLVGKTP